MMQTASYHSQLASQFVALIDDKWFLAFSVLVVFDLVLDLIKPYIVPTKRSDNPLHNVVMRNVLTFTLVSLVYPYLLLLSKDTEMVALAFLMAFVYQYLVWIVENWVEMGWWLPQPLVNFVKAKLLDSEKDLDKKLGGKK